ncbi:MAG: tetratricopeptide repeat protein [Desulfobacterales bacterium]|nr:tetratricopeptide repeat protein [Desulfobacterales bacterium]
MGYAQVGDFKNAENTFTRILKIVPDSSKAHNNLGNLYLQMNHPDRAFEEFQKPHEFAPENCLYHFNFGIVAMETGRYPDAVQAFNKALLLRPGWAMAHKNLGILYYDYLDNLEKGITHFKKALALNPSIPDAEPIRRVVNNFEKQKIPDS